MRNAAKQKQNATANKKEQLTVTQIEGDHIMEVIGMAVFLKMF